MNIVSICKRIIEYSFYALFLLVPLVFSGATSELFELNKMWLTWAFTIIIATSWGIKMIFERKFHIQKTPLDIPIVLFLVSQVISSILSLDRHVSFWGYYSRFNGGLLSTIAYILLYYAFLSNFKDDAIRVVKKIVSVSLISGLIVALWGLPSHFGFDPTCFVFRGSFDVSCWTSDFVPTIRMFSTLGQPVWLAAYLAILIPIAIVYVFKKINDLESSKKNIFRILYLAAVFLFYIDLVYTGSRSGFLGIWLSLILMLAVYFWIEKKTFSRIKKEKINYFKSAQNLKSPIMIITIGFLIITFVIGTPVSKLNTFTFGGIINSLQKTQSSQSDKNQNSSENSKTPTSELGGTDSGKIRSYVWQGAINAWKNNFLFGTGVETFASAYYKYKPVGQNLTSEWNFLYNKAHNEYLNYLATTGIFGLGSYLLMIGYFLFFVFSKITKSEFLISKQIPNPKSELGQLEIRSIRNLILALLASYFSILITNFFGFSVVITNVYLFLIPAFVFVLLKPKSPNPNKAAEIIPSSSVWQWTPAFLVFLAGFYLLFVLGRYWTADTAYALGTNLDKAGEYQAAYQNLVKAVRLRSNEPVFKDQLAVNEANIATSLLLSQIENKNEDTEESKQTKAVAISLTQESIRLSNDIISQYPNNVVFWKSRVRLFYTLSQVDSKYLSRALDAIQKTSLIAPNDANIIYNLGVLYGQNNDIGKGVDALEKTIQLKPDYRDARYALGLFYRTLATNDDGTVVKDDAINQKAIEQVKYILKNINPKDTEAQESLKNWQEK